MQTLQELQTKQLKEIELFTKQQEIKEILKDIDFNLSIGWKTKFDLRINLEKTEIKEAKEIIKKVVSLLKPTGEKHPIYDCKYYFNFSNPCQYAYKIDFNYMHNGISIDFNLSLNIIDKGVIKTGFRKITDCEYHYFTGMTIPQMQKMDFRTYQLNDNVLKQPVINYFGGSKSYKTNFVADYKKIISLLTKNIIDI